MSVQWHSDAFSAGLDRLLADADEAMRTFAAEGAAAVARQGQLNSSGRPGPNVRSGDHRRSYVVSPPRQEGPYRWVAHAGPTMVYSRTLEQGHPRWPTGVKYPSLGPAVEYFRRVGAGVLMARLVRRIMRG